MNWTELLKAEVDQAYKATFGLLELVEDETLGWKPATGDNWMTVGQLLMHLTISCGAGCKGFVTGEWGVPEGDMSPEDMLPAAERLPTVETVGQARRLLGEDRELALAMIDQAGEEALATREMGAPWSPEFHVVLGRHLLTMVAHLTSHKGQLFYYLKLQGKPVNTGHLWAM